MGLVPSLNMPGGNVTGTTTLGVTLGAKRLQLLRELLTTGATVALFSNPRNANAAAEAKEIDAAAKVLGVRLLVLNATSPSGLDVAFERIAQENVSGLLNAADPFIISQRDRIIALAAVLRAGRGPQVPPAGAVAVQRETNHPDCVCE